eukprot:SM000041S15526  [mRNA]  locus=s41:646910:654114:+ [translate_table: standard]
MAAAARWRVAAWLAVLWAASLLHGELLAFLSAGWACSWPRLPLEAGSLSGRPVHVALIADPQLVKHAWMPAPLQELAQFHSVLYMRRAYQHCVLAREPDIVLTTAMLLPQEGSYASSGRLEQILQKYGFIAGQRGSDLRWSSEGLRQVPLILMSDDPVTQQVEQTAAEYPLAVVESMDAGAVTFITSRAATNASLELGGQGPLVLLTQLPLHLSEGSLCTDGRKAYVFSTRDISDCILKHDRSSGVALEHAIGSFSWLSPAIYPSFTMLTVAPQSDQVTSNVLAVTICYLPVQIRTYLWYLLLSIISVVALLTWPKDWSPSPIDIFQYFKRLAHEISESAKAPKLKSGDDEEEFEMVWDAEGQMHLVKKAPVTRWTIHRSSSEGSLGALQQRHTSAAKQEIEVAQPSAPMTSLDVKGRPRSISFLGKFVRALTPLLLLAGLVSALYGILLVHSWTIPQHQPGPVVACHALLRIWEGPGGAYGEDELRRRLA